MAEQLRERKPASKAANKPASKPIAGRVSVSSGLELKAPTLGNSIRSTRILKGLKLRELADRAGCSESLLSKIENRRVNPSLGTLKRIADALQVSVATLLSPVDHTRIIMRAGERPLIRIDRSGSRAERLVPPDRGHLLEGHLHVLEPGGGSEGALAHEGEEVGYVISGQLHLQVGSEAYDLKAGDSFAFRSEIEHRFRNPGPGETRVIWVSTPSRYAEPAGD